MNNEQLIILVSCLAIILGIKLALIGRYGSISPYWDQWDGEADLIFKPYLNGTLGLEALTRPHNEHRILWTRLISLALLKLNGYWDPLREMVVNALIHIAAIGIFIFTLSVPSRRTATSYIIGVVSIGLFSLPFGFENLLWGFQSQFHLVLLFGFLSIYFVSTSPAWSFKWLAGTALACFDYFSLASGALTFLALVIIRIIQLTTAREICARELIGIIFHGLAFVLCFYYIPMIPHHQPLQAASLAQLFRSFIDASSWPIAEQSWGLVGGVIAVLFIYAPTLILLFSLATKRRSLNDRRWYFLALGVWIALQVAALAFGRGAAGLGASRYFDTFIIPVALNFTCMVLLTNWPSKVNYGSLLGFLLVCAWTFVVGFGLTNKAINQLPQQLSSWHDLRNSQTDNLRRYLLTDDASYLENRPIPYGDSNRLKTLLSDPQIRSLLPTALFKPNNDEEHQGHFIFLAGLLFISIGNSILLATVVALQRVDSARGKVP